MSMLYQLIEQIQFDLNVTSNAYCPGCHRYSIFEGEMYLNPHLDFNKSIDVEIIERAMDNPRIIDEVWVDMVGLVGEPIAHNDFLDIVDIIYKHKPNAHLNIHTNGGLRTPEFFKELAHRLKNDYVIQFSVDGLEDTNNIYRIGVKWEKIIENIKAFCDAGGNATWKTIKFPWNEHQLEEIEKFAYSLGVNNFRVERNRDEGADRWINKYMSASKNFHYKTKAPIGIKDPIDLSEYTRIENKCFDKGAIYINYDGRVLPCCMFNAALTDECYMDEMLPYINENNGDWNSLKHNTLEAVMTNKWWHKLYGHLGTDPCSVCIDACGR